MIRAGMSVTASNAQRIASRLVIGTAWTAMWATSSMSVVPSPYQGSMTQSWPRATVTPCARSSGMRVRPRRRG